VQDRDKEYVFTLKFGEETDTYDSTGKVIATSTNYPKLDKIANQKKHNYKKTDEKQQIYQKTKN